ncbi:MAG: helix-turn-helix domain-containing protein [Planctomycetes bacterium]|nr:helix-turn-helix domain-containing protein [Planctomycetota bacterium]
MRVACSITLTGDERRALEGLLSDESTPQRLVLRTRIILLAARGKSNQQIAARLNTDPHTVGRWRNRFRIDRLEGLKRKPATLNGSHISRHEEIARRILEKTTMDQPAKGSRWTIRTLAAELGISRSTVHRVWQDADLKPHLCNPEESTPHPQT